MAIANNSAVSTKLGDEPEIASLTNPSFSTIPGSTVILGGGAMLVDHATLSGGLNPTGIITFRLFDPGSTGRYRDSFGLWQRHIYHSHWFSSGGCRHMSVGCGLSRRRREHVGEQSVRRRA
jgi:hypothetical protein